MDRRAFTCAIAASFAATSTPTRAQSRIALVGYLSAGTASGVSHLHENFRRGMTEHGWLQGKNLRLENRFAEGNFERLPILATELVGLKPDVVVAAPTPSALAASKATATIPIVIVAVGDPERTGLVKNLRRPEGNVTGLAFSVGLESFNKGLELLRQVLPGARRIAVLTNPGNPAQSIAFRDLAVAAMPLGMQLQLVEARDAAGLEPAFAAMARERAEALVVVTDPLFLLHRTRLAELEATYRLPSMHGASENVDAGALMSYAPDLASQFHRAASYVDKLLRGAKPADLPVEQPSRFDLIVNLRTARSLGLTLPPTLLAQAQRTIGD